jgi:hypothetical protein
MGDMRGHLAFRAQPNIAAQNHAQTVTPGRACTFNRKYRLNKRPFPQCDQLVSGYRTIVGLRINAGTDKLTPLCQRILPAALSHAATTFSQDAKALCLNSQ